jgi:glycosyltransferase involved in cell wall biosynthesis
MPPRVSVVMPAYNAAHTIARTMESILNQTFTDFEFIIVDDGSKDDTWKIITEYAAADQRIIPILHEVNQGNTAARNTGGKLARGEYIAVQDADDISLPHRLERQVAYLDAHPEAGAVASQADKIDAHDNVFALWKVPSTPETVRVHLLLTNPLPHTTVMLRRDLYERLGGYHMVNGQDHELLWNISQVSEIHTIPESLAQYRGDDRDSNRVTVKETSQQTIASHEISVRAAKLLLNGQPLDEDAYRRFFMSGKGFGHMQAGDTARLKPFWNALVADPIYRKEMGLKLLSCSLRNVRSVPLEALRLTGTAYRQFGVPLSHIAKKYTRALVLDPLTRRTSPQTTDSP